jgi:hypothetical protein
MWRLVADGGGVALLVTTFLGLLLGRVRAVLERVAEVVCVWRELRRTLRPPVARVADWASASGLAPELATSGEPDEGAINDEGPDRDAVRAFGRRRIRDSNS